jgi:hypothetical protein
MTEKSAAPRTEPMNQFLRCVEKMRAAEQSGEDPAPYRAQARQWLDIVKLTNPAEAESLELELSPRAGRGATLDAAEAEDRQAAQDRRLFFVRLAWLGVPFACLFMIAGGNVLVQYLSGLCLAGLLAFIFLP